jgi:hypothetical protein
MPWERDGPMIDAQDDPRQLWAMLAQRVAAYRHDVSGTSGAPG